MNIKMKLKVYDFIKSIYSVCLIMIVGSVILAIIMVRHSNYYSPWFSIIIGILTGVVSSCIVTVFINIRLDQMSNRRKKSALFNLIMCMEHFNNYAYQEKPERKSENQKIIWAYIKMSDLIQELRIITSYYYDVLDDEEFSVARDIVTRYSFVKEIFIDIENENPIYLPEFQEEGDSLLSKHQSLRKKVSELFADIILQVEVLERLFLYFLFVSVTITLLYYIK